MIQKSVITDPVESIIARALDKLGMTYVHQLGPAGLDFYLQDHDLHIEVKQFHTPRIAEQMGRADNVIAIQGIKAAQLFAKLITNQVFYPVAQQDRA